MSRFAIELSYDGTNYHGWQSQKNAKSVQSEVEVCLFKLLRNPIKIFGCGRTDTGVHAKRFIAHFEHENLSEDFAFRMNKMLPDDIAINQVFEVPDKFHARFDAISRTYHYTISKNKEAIFRNQVYWDSRLYDLDLMNVACKIILQTKDFGAFCKQHSENKTNLCDVQIAEWTSHDHYLIFVVKADRFLRNMVRAMVGTMLELGRNRINMADFKSILVSKNRVLAGPSAPAQGLMLSDVEYNRTDWKSID